METVRTYQDQHTDWAQRQPTSNPEGENALVVVYLSPTEDFDKNNSKPPL